jgi:hypothetical protein
MPLGVDLTRPLRSRADQLALVVAVRDAPAAEPETNYLEWKGTLELVDKAALRTRSHRGSVTPASKPSTRPKLEARIAAYVGANVQWRPDYVELEGKSVLVVTIESPRWGEAGHPVRKTFTDGGKTLLKDGAILVRRHASTTEANAQEIEALARRAARRAENDLAIDIRLRDATALRRIDVSEEAIARLAREREQIMLSALKNNIGAFHLVTAVSPLGYGEYRTEEKYRKEVADWGAALVEELPGVLLARSVLHNTGRLRLLVANETERTFTGVRVELTLPGDFDVCTWKEEVEGESELPRSPALFGQGSRALGHGGFDLGRPLRLPLIKPAWRPDSQALDGRTRVIFSDQQVRAEGTSELPETGWRSTTRPPTSSPWSGRRQRRRRGNGFAARSWSPSPKRLLSRNGCWRRLPRVERAAWVGRRHGARCHAMVDPGVRQTAASRSGRGAASQRGDVARIATEYGDGRPAQLRSGGSRGQWVAGRAECDPKWPKLATLARDAVLRKLSRRRARLISVSGDRQTTFPRLCPAAAHRETPCVRSTTAKLLDTCGGRCAHLVEGLSSVAFADLLVRLQLRFQQPGPELLARVFEFTQLPIVRQAPAPGGTAGAPGRRRLRFEQAVRREQLHRLGNGLLRSAGGGDELRDRCRARAQGVDHPAGDVIGEQAQDLSCLVVHVLYVRKVCYRKHGDRHEPRTLNDRTDRARRREARRAGDQAPLPRGTALSAAGHAGLGAPGHVERRGLAAARRGAARARSGGRVARGDDRVHQHAEGARAERDLASRCRYRARAGAPAHAAEARGQRRAAGMAGHTRRRRCARAR